MSRILISEAQPPTLAQYGVASVDDETYLRARSDDAMPPAADADTQTTASASPCQPGVARTWHIAVYLEPEAAARSRGLTQAAFDLNVTLSSARRDAEEALGERFDLREFHEAVLMNGAMPLDILRDNLSEWAAAQ